LSYSIYVLQRVENGVYVEFEIDYRELLWRLLISKDLGAARSNSIIDTLSNVQCKWLYLLFKF